MDIVKQSRQVKHRENELIGREFTLGEVRYKHQKLNSFILNPLIFIGNFLRANATSPTVPASVILTQQFH